MKIHAVRTVCLSLALVAAGCHGAGGNGNNGNGGSGGSGGGGVGGVGDGGAGVPDLAPAGDMTDTTPIPAPKATHVGATGVSAGLVSDGNTHAAYLLTPKAATASTATTGELHVTDATGKDVKVAATAYLGGYLVSPDGKSLLFTQLAAGAKTATLSWLDLTTANATAKTVLSSLPAQPVDQAMTTFAPAPLGQIGFFTPSSKFFLVGNQVLQTSLDLHTIDLSSGADVFTRPNGGFDYQEIVLPDDTILFQDTVGGSAATPPVQTLLFAKLGANATVSTITSHTSSFQPTADGKTLIILKTSGDLLTWDLTARTGSGNKIASGVARYSVGAGGSIAYLGADKSVHVVGSDGTKLADLAAAAAGADVTGPVFISDDGADVYWFQAVDTEDNRGTLMHAGVSASPTAAMVGTNISIVDVRIVDGALVLLQNVDNLGQFGDAARAKRDGSSLAALGTKVNVGGLMAVNPGPATWFALHLTGAAISATNSPIDGSLPLTGALAWDDYSGAAELTVDPTVHAGAFAFSDDGRDVVYAGGAAFDATASNYLGALKFLATRAPGTPIDGALAGVSEIGPIVSRALFVNAPGATPAGVYFVQY
jgi:hypothetical protein